MVGVDAAKTALYDRLKIGEVGPGYCHFPIGRDQEYFDQLTAERKFTRYHNGYPKQEWRKPPAARNEALDCRVYAYAALQALYASGLKLGVHCDRFAKMAGSRRKGAKTIPPTVVAANGPPPEPAEPQENEVRIPAPFERAIPVARGIEGNLARRSGAGRRGRSGAVREQLISVTGSIRRFDLVVGDIPTLPRGNRKGPSDRGGGGIASVPSLGGLNRDNGWADLARQEHSSNLRCLRAQFHGLLLLRAVPMWTPTSAPSKGSTLRLTIP
jgi:hypothetical protein